MNFIVNIRDRRQVTIPKEILMNLGVTVGDKMVFDLKENEIRLKPQKQMVIDSLKAIQKAFKDSGVSKKEILRSGEEIRRKLVAERYGKKS